MILELRLELMFEPVIERNAERLKGCGARAIVGDFTHQRGNQLKLAGYRLGENTASLILDS